MLWLPHWPSVETASEGRGEDLGIFARLLPWGTLWEGKFHRLGREGRKGKASYVGDYCYYMAPSSMRDSLGKLLEGEGGLLDNTGVDGANGLTQITSGFSR